MRIGYGRFASRNGVIASEVAGFHLSPAWRSGFQPDQLQADRRTGGKAERRKVGGINQDHGENSNKRTNIQKGLGAPG